MFAARAATSVYFLLSLSLLAAAAPSSLTAPSAAAPIVARGDTGNSCSTGNIQCCEQVQSSTDPVVSIILGLLGIVLGPIEALVGLDCSPVTVVGVGTGNECSSTTVCCDNNNTGGLISIGCVPISL